MIHGQPEHSKIYITPSFVSGIAISIREPHRHTKSSSSDTYKIGRLELLGKCPYDKHGTSISYQIWSIKSKLLHSTKKSFLDLIMGFLS